MTKITQPKGGTASSTSGKNSGTSKPKKGNQNPTIRKGG
jgi:hypothetical protein